MIDADYGHDGHEHSTFRRMQKYDNFTCDVTIEEFQAQAPSENYRKCESSKSYL